MSNMTDDNQIVYGISTVRTMFKTSVDHEELTGTLNGTDVNAPQAVTESDIGDQILRLSELSSLHQTFSGHDFYARNDITSPEGVTAEAQLLRVDVSPQEADALLMVLAS